MSKMNGTQEDRQRISLSIWAENKGELDDAINNAGKVIRKIRTIDDDLTKSREEIIAVQRDLEDCLNVYRPLSVFENSPYQESVWRKIKPLKELIGGINSTIGGYLKQQTKKVNTKVSRLILDSVSKTSIDANITIDNLNNTVQGYYLLIEAITLPHLKKALISLPKADQPNSFILSYGHVVHSIASFRDDKIETAYLKANSPMEVRVASESLERKLSGIISNERAIVEDFLEEFPLNSTTTANAANISRRQKKKFLDAGLTPSVNALYREMQKVCSSGMKYFDLKRELRADVMYLERSLSFIQRIQPVKGKTCSQQESQEIKEIAEHKNYLEQHKELESMILVKREVERYQKIYSQVVDDAKKLLEDINKQSQKVMYTPPIPTPSNKDVQTQPQVPVDKVTASPQKPTLKVVEGYAVVKEHGVESRIKAEQSAKPVEYEQPQGSAPQSSKGNEPKKAQPQQPSTLYNTNTTLKDIHEPEDSTLKAFYYLLHRRDPKGRIWLASPIELAQMIGLVELDIKGDNGGQYTETDKLFFRDVVGYLHNPETLMYGAIKGSEINSKYAPKLIEEIQKRI